MSTAARSRPARARGLKLMERMPLDGPFRSRPARARGLKQIMTSPDGITWTVAPRAGAWIETNLTREVSESSNCRAPRGRVD